MKKTLIAAAALMAMAGAAQAQVSIYGLIDLSYGKSIYDDAYNYKADFHSGGDDGSSQGNSTSRIGLKGSMDVGGGTKINFRLETGGIESNGSVNNGGSFFDRQMWAGFSGSWGEVRLGRQDSVPFQTMIDFDFNGASNGVSSGGYTKIGAWNTGRQSRSLQYISPNMGGLTAQFGFVPKNEDSSYDGSDKAVFSAGLKYATGPLAVAATIETKRESNTKGFWSVAGSYDFGVAKAMLSYANAGKPDDGGEGKGFGIGAVAPLAGANVGFMFHKNQDGGCFATGCFSDGGQAWEIFANKEIFKGTYLYGEIGRFTGKGTYEAAARSATGFAVGTIFTF